jgi:hypothetical protein
MRKLIALLVVQTLASPALAEDKDIGEAVAFTATFVPWCMEDARGRPVVLGLYEEELPPFCGCSAMAIVRELPQSDWMRWKEDRAIADRVMEFNISCRDQFLCRRKHTVEQCRSILGYD